MNRNNKAKRIQLDLEWMHRVGIGNVQSFDTAYDTSQLVEQRLIFMAPPWPRRLSVTRDSSVLRAHG
jgi:(4-O-methyl)-D-glucuronate---lignin esterase